MRSGRNGAKQRKLFSKPLRARVNTPVAFGVGIITVVVVSAVWFGVVHSSGPHRRTRATPATSTTTTILNVYARTAAGMLSQAVSGVPSRVYVPDSESDTVEVIDPAT